jgi:hypothetical protein
MKFGILGTGHVATILAGAWSKTHEITLGSGSVEAISAVGAGVRRGVTGRG